jgi:leader peptidase (prepilin peptidase) / N-methyltransferase
MAGPLDVFGSLGGAASWLLLLFIFLFGLIFGSFLNVCIYRIPRDLSVVSPRSFCPECGSRLPWTQNVPLLSYLLLRGRCRNCSQPIGFRYPLVELTTGLLFLSIAIRYALTLLAIKWLLFDMILVVLFWTDLEERILPDELTLGGSFIAVLFSLFVVVPGSLGALLLPEANWRMQSLLNAAIGAALLALPVWGIGAAYGRLRKREALGWGDVKLLAMLGLFLGPKDGLAALLLGSVSGAVVGLGLLIWMKKTTRSYELPFGSFLCAGAALIPFLSASTHRLLGVP